MEENLVIVESPAKAKTIEKFLGSSFKVKSSFGHIRDLEKKNLGILIDQSYSPQYVISEDKLQLVSDLKKSVKQAKMVWLASDEDREGEAIAWHLYEVLGLKPENTHRIVFHEITKDAILNAINNPRDIDINLVHSQQARRVLDRLVGFEISPILWKKIKPQLSAGRVQSVAVKLLVEREREINNFVTSSVFKTQALFSDKNGNNSFVAELDKKFSNKEEANTFLERCISASFIVNNIETKPGKRTPPPPFTTSTLQQEASRKLGFSVSQTMSVAQRLYESGKITYMRTDSVNLSNLAIAACKQTIIDNYGEKYSQVRNYKTKTKGAQEAHEAIRPTYPNQATIEGTVQEKRLYDLIRKRTLASQMSDALMEKTTITINISNNPERFIATGEVVKFDGYLKVYTESFDEEKEDEHGIMLPAIEIGQNLSMQHIIASQKFTQHPPRYTEASLVKKLEELGIGRPSTYAPTISTIQLRGYVVKDSREGSKRDFVQLTLSNGKIKTATKSEVFGTEKNKLFPEDIGIVVNDFLENYFPNIMNYGFTATVEKNFDEIADGSQDWVKIIDEFYRPFHKVIETTAQTSEKVSGEKRLGIDPSSGKPVIARIGRYGAMIQIGESTDEEKPKFASLLKDQKIGTITLEEALALFNFPRKLGLFEEKEVVVNIGRFGPYVMHNGKYASINAKIDNPEIIDYNRAVELILAKREADLQKIIHTFENDPDMQVLNGRFGPYIVYKKENYKLPKGTDAQALTYEDCVKIVSEVTPSNGKKKAQTKKTATKAVKKETEDKTSKKSTSKKTTAKKTTSKKATTKKTTTKKTTAKKTVSKTE